MAPPRRTVQTVSESEAIVALAELGANACAYSAMYFSITFAFLTVAYLVGAALSKFQCILVSALYAFSALTVAATGIGYSHAWILLKAREVTILDEVWVFNRTEWIEGLVFAAIAVSTASLYFMYDIRKTKKS